MILIKTRVKKFHIDRTKLKKMVQKMLEVLGYKDFDVGILLTTNATIKRYNQIFRKKDKPTDILSFPFHTEIKPGQKIQAKTPEEKNLGDIIISLEYVAQKAGELGRTFDQHLRILLAHGIAHLLNYDHQTDQEFKKMMQIEKKLLDVLKSIR